MDSTRMRWAVVAAVIAVGLVLACVAFPEVRALVPDWPVN